MTTIRRIVFALDPALRRPGVAALVNDELFACGSLTMPKRVNDLDIGIRIDEVAVACAAWWRQTQIAIADQHRTNSIWLNDAVPPIVCYEKPQIYGGPRVEDPNDAMHIGMVAAAVWARVRVGAHHTSVVTPTPREWTMNTSKSKTGDPWASQRGGLLARRLSPAERALVPDNHDAIDAACLALFTVGRLKAIRVNARPAAAQQP